MKTLKAIAIGLVLMSVAGFAMAQTTGSITMSGAVAAVTKITCGVFATTVGMDFETEGAQTVNIATITEISNNRTGYVIGITSANGGDGNPHFKGTGLNTDTLAYTLKYNGATISLTGGANAAAKTFGTKTTKSGEASVVNVSYTNSTTTYLNADTYSDTLTFTITAN